MTIICGTDFSPAARDATHVAARLSCRLKEDLVLVHAVAPPPSDPLTELDLDPVRGAFADALEREAAEPRAKGLEVATLAEMGSPDEVIVRVARQRDANLIVLGAVGQRRGTHWLLGSVADHVARTTPVPLLLVRDAKRLEAWIESRETLRVLLATDLSPVSDFALDWLQTAFAPAGKADVLLVYVANPGVEAGRLHLGGPIPHHDLNPVADEVVRRELRERTGRLSLGGRVSHAVRVTFGHIGAEIANAAGESNADLVVVGAHQRGLLARATHESVARTVIQSASANVLLVPFHTADEKFRALEAPRIKTILAATDFSPCANRAVAWAMSIAPPGSKVVIFNATNGRVTSEQATEDLEHFEHPRSWPDNVEVSVVVRKDKDVARAIWGEAQRADADVIVVGAHGESGLRALVGNVTREVIALSTKPVLVVRDETT